MIRTNKIISDIDYSEFDKRYDIFKIITDEKFIKDGAHILDSPLEELKAKSVCFQSGRELFILFDKNTDNYELLNRHIQKSETGKSLILKRIESQDMERYLLIQLLINSLNNSNHKFLKFNNVTGKLFSKPIISKDKKQIYAVEVRITQEMLLTLDVQTFTSIIIKDKIKFTKREFHDYPQYAFDKNSGAFKRALKSDKLPLSDIYIPRQIKDRRNNNVDFMSISDYESFTKSKMGILDDVTREFKKQFANIVLINFHSEKDYVELTLKERNEKKTNIGKMLKEYCIHVVDGINDANSKEFINELISLLKSFPCKITKGKQISKDKLNIKLIHNKEYYSQRNEADPYEKNLDIAVQHITYEDCEIGKIVDVILKELIIKNDIKKGVISIVNWDEYHYKNNWIFGKKYDDDRFLFMTISPDGSFSFKALELDLFNQDEYQKYIDILGNSDVKGIIENQSGEINIIKNSGWFTLPEFEKISMEMERVSKEYDFEIEDVLRDLNRIEVDFNLTSAAYKASCQIKSNLETLKNSQTVISKKELIKLIYYKTIRTILNKLYENTDKQFQATFRNKEKRSELLSSITDIKYFGKSDTEKYYFTGYIGAGMKPDLNHACLIRKISATGGGKVFSEDLLPLMNVDFVSNGKLTVIPFPFKYLNEYADKFKKVP